MAKMFSLHLNNSELASRSLIWRIISVVLISNSGAESNTSVFFKSNDNFSVKSITLFDYAVGSGRSVTYDSAKLLSWKISIFIDHISDALNPLKYLHYFLNFSTSLIFTLSYDYRRVDSRTRSSLVCFACLIKWPV